MKRVEFSVDGAALRGELHQPEGRLPKPLPLVVLLHGLASCRKEWYTWPEDLARHGYSVLALDLRGHGESDGPRGLVSVERVHSDVEAAIKAMAPEYGVDADRVGLVGHSLGAAMAVSVAQALKPVRALVAMAPPSRLAKELSPFESAGYFVADKLNRPVRLFVRRGLSIPYKVAYERLYASRGAVERARRNPFLQTWIPVANYGPLIKRLDAERAARTLRKPTLVLVAEFDALVGPWNSRKVFNALAAPKKELVVIPRSGHSMAGDHQSGLVLSHVRRWLDRHVKEAAAA